jgi:hypothetical protein
MCSLRLRRSGSQRRLHTLSALRITPFLTLAVQDAGFSRRQLAAVLRRDHSGSGPAADSTTIAQMAAALGQAGFGVGCMAQFLGPRCALHGPDPAINGLRERPYRVMRQPRAP